jgi:hypothetical protein
VCSKAQKHCNPRQKETVDTILKGKSSNVGLLLNERMMNLPYILVP